LDGIKYIRHLHLNLGSLPEPVAIAHHRNHIMASTQCRFDNVFTRQPIRPKDSYLHSLFSSDGRICSSNDRERPATA